MIIAPAFLSAVLAERRRRELARLATTRATYSANTGPFGPPNPYAAPPAPLNPYAVPAGPFGPPSPYGAQPAQYSPPPPPQGRLYPGPPPAPVQDTTKVNAEGWHAPGSEPDQWT
jgi:hypothetical protein